MTPVVWALTPIVVTALVWAVVAWRGRSRKRGGNPFATVHEHERFRAALAGPPRDAANDAEGPVRSRRS